MAMRWTRRASVWSFVTETSQTVTETIAVAPPPVTVDPAAFFLKLPSVNTLTDIRGKLTIKGDDFVGDVDHLIVHNAGGAPSADGQLTASALTGLGMAATGIVYEGIEDVTIDLGAGVDHFEVASTVDGTTTINTGAGHDVVPERGESVRDVVACPRPGRVAP